jgi:NAD(P)-dependent dehydrogenase (short-subunit alcohol dehydrogenase family)
MFFRRSIAPPNIAGKRVILAIGGSGVLGKAFFQEKPADCFIISVSRRGDLVGEDVLNLHYDLYKSPEGLIKQLAKITQSVDVIIPMIRDKNFTSIENLDRKKFLGEIDFDVFLPIRLSLLCGKQFWAKVSKEENLSMGRKIINISSGAAFLKSNPQHASYSGAKAALTIMTEYLHDFMFSKYGISAHTIAPGSLRNEGIQRMTVEALWNLERRVVDRYTLQKIY